MGLVSPGGVHSHQDHAAALAQILADGRRADGGACLHRRPRHAAALRPATTSRGLRRRCRPRCAIATVSGRYYAMDRDKRWERVTKAYDAMVDARGRRAFADAGAVIADAYAQASHRRIRAAGGDRRLSRHARRRRPAVLQFPRRPGAARSSAPCSIRASPASRAPRTVQLRRRRRHDANTAPR